MNFNQIISEVSENLQNHSRGYFNCIPFMGMERFEEFVPGIEQDTYILLTASAGVGKSKLARFLFIHSPLQYVEEHPEADIKLTIKYFSLEESKKKVVLAEISKYLFTKYNLIVSIRQLQSRGRYNTISADVLEKIREAEAYVDNFLSKVEIIDSIRHPTGIFLHMRDYAMQIGKYYDSYGNPLTPQEHEMIKNKEGETYKKVSFYRKDHPRHYVIVLVDHLALLQPEKLETLWQTMGKFSSNYCLHMRDKWGFIPVIVQQQASAKEQVEYNYRGHSIEEKLEPSLDGLGDNKTTQRDANLVLGLFAPDRYNIKEHGNYNIERLADRYRSLSILKSRDGVPNRRLPLFFNGAVDFFKELPAPNNLVGMQKVYTHIDNLNKGV